MRPGFPKCGAWNWHLPLKRGACELKISKFGACELKISKFGRLWAKIWVKIEAVEAKISKFSQKGVLRTDSFAWIVYQYRTHHKRRKYYWHWTNKHILENHNWTRPGVTINNVLLTGFTVGSIKSRGTFTSKCIDTVSAVATILARVWMAIINILKKKIIHHHRLVFNPILFCIVRMICSTNIY